MSPPAFSYDSLNDWYMWYTDYWCSCFYSSIRELHTLLKHSPICLFFLTSKNKHHRRLIRSLWLVWICWYDRQTDQTKCKSELLSSEFLSSLNFLARQTDAKQCIRAHCAWAQVGSKNLKMSGMFFFWSLTVQIIPRWDRLTYEYTERTLTELFVYSNNAQSQWLFTFCNSF